MANAKKKVCMVPAKAAELEDNIRDLINFVKIKSQEELELGEGRKIEDDTAAELVDKLRELAEKLGVSLE